MTTETQGDPPPAPEEETPAGDPSDPTAEPEEEGEEDGEGA